jgi:hypothetical protein
MQGKAGPAKKTNLSRSMTQEDKEIRACLSVGNPHLWNPFVHGCCPGKMGDSQFAMLSQAYSTLFHHQKRAGIMLKQALSTHSWRRRACAIHCLKSLDGFILMPRPVPDLPDSSRAAPVTPQSHILLTELPGTVLSGASTLKKRTCIQKQAFGNTESASPAAADSVPSATARNPTSTCRNSG